MKFYRVKEILPDVYRICSDEQVYMELFVGSEKALLFDTGYGFGNIHDLIKSITDKPLYIVNSHGHLDHTCGNYQFCEDIYIHPKDIELCRKHNSPEERRIAIEHAKHTLDYVSGKISNILPNDFNEKTYMNQGPGNLVPVTEGEIFRLGGKTLQVYEVPGHTAGSIGLLYLEERIFYAGDSMNQFVWLFFPEALSISEYLRTLHKAKDQIPFEQLVMGHSPIIAEKSILDTFLDAAENIDFEHGEPLKTDLAPNIEGRICPRKGYAPYEMNRTGYASVVIGESQLS